jgi:para-nitrobenzyl esterase
VFKGIPYAAPPVGELRWQDPQPPEAWTGVRQATEFGTACIQPESKSLEGAGEVGPQSEDCLYLNIWTPTTDPNAKLPVMVWIHGGALVIGAGSLPLYDGTPLSERGAVVVTLNYRLGHLGFFSHPALDKVHPGGTVNYGLLDQIAALKWVQENIAQFGGDPNNVMIFGESAGGQSVLAHFASPLSRGLFHKGVAESSYGIPSNTRAKALDAGIKVADSLGLPGADATLAELRAVPANKFGPLNDKGLTLAPGFVIGDAALPETILDTFQKGNEAPVPLIIGNNSDEATVAESFGIDPAKVISELGIARIAVKSLYPGVNDNETLGRYVIRDLVFTSFAKRMADLHAARAPSWRYYFSYVPVNLRDQEPGVPHGGEIVFVFGTGDIAPVPKTYFTNADREMSKEVGDYWFAFARTGRPEPDGQPEWAQNDARNDSTMEFGETITLQTNFMRTRLNIYIGVLNLLGRILGKG